MVALEVLPGATGRVSIVPASASASAPATAPCTVPAGARLVVTGPAGTLTVPPPTNGAPYLSFHLRVTVENAAGRPLRCLTVDRGTWDTWAGTWTRSGPLWLSDAPFYVQNGCQTNGGPRCAWIQNGISQWIVSGPLLEAPPPVTMRLTTPSGVVMQRFPVRVRIGGPPPAST